MRCLFIWGWQYSGLSLPEGCTCNSMETCLQLCGTEGKPTVRFVSLSMSDIFSILGHPSTCSMSPKPGTWLCTHLTVLVLKEQLCMRAVAHCVVKSEVYFVNLYEWPVSITVLWGNDGVLRGSLRFRDQVGNHRLYAVTTSLLIVQHTISTRKSML